MSNRFMDWQKYPKSKSQSENDNLKHWIAQNDIPYQEWEIEP